MFLIPETQLNASISVNHLLLRSTVRLSLSKSLEISDHLTDITNEPTLFHRALGMQKWPDLRNVGYRN